MKQSDPAVLDVADAGLPANLVIEHFGTLSLLDGSAFDRAMKLAELMASARGLPGFFQASPGTCLAAIEEGLRLGISRFVVARMMYQVHPSAPLAYLGKFIVAVVNTHPDVDQELTFEHVGPWQNVSGRFTMVPSKRRTDESGEPVKYAKAAWPEEAEEGLKVVATAKLRQWSAPRSLELAMHRCWPRNSTLWATDPAHQICYVAARRWADRFAPQILLGMATDAEQDGMIDITTPAQQEPPPPPPPPKPKRLAQWLDEHTQVEQPQQESPPAPPATTDQGKPAAAVDAAKSKSGPTMVALTIPGRPSETLALGTAAQLLLTAARDQSPDWIEAATLANPWVAKHRYTREALAAIATTMAERGAEVTDDG